MPTNRSTTQSLLKFFEIIGWLTVIAGIILMLYAWMDYSTPSFDQNLPRDFSMVISGAAISFGSLWLVAMSRIGGTVVDIANSNDLILLALDPELATQAAAAEAVPTEPAASAKPLPDGVVEEVRGVPIHQLPNGKFRTLGVDFDTRAEARLHVFAGERTR